MNIYLIEIKNAMPENLFLKFAMECTIKLKMAWKKIGHGNKGNLRNFLEVMANLRILKKDYKFINFVV